MTLINDEVSILIVGYDGYSDVWDHYVKLLNKYWNNRPKTYFATSELNPKYDGIQIIQAGKNSEWSKKVYTSLDQIDTKYIILLLEDFFTTTYVKNKELKEVIDIMNANDIKYCKLLDQKKIKGEFFENTDYLHIIKKREEYGISLQPAIWRTDFLKDTVGRENYNAWIFEFNQVKNPIQNLDTIDCIVDDRNILQITHSIVQGKYLRGAIRTFKKQNYNIDLSVRSTLSVSDNLMYFTKRFFAFHSPVFLKPLLKNIGKLFGVEFISDRELGGEQNENTSNGS